MLTNFKRRTALLLTAAVLCSVTALAPTTAGAVASVVPNAGTAADVFEAPDNTTLLRACPGDSAPAAGFTDTTSTDVDCLAALNITTGATATTYEPAGTIPRWQMALFIHRMFVPTGVAAAGTTTVPAFTDISGLSTEIQNAVNALASHGITVGTTATTFSPDDLVTREQMAIFLSRFADIAKAPAGGAIPSTKTTGKFNYSDIAQTSFEGMESIIRIYNLAAAGETCVLDGVALGDPTGGCGSTYRPTESITRAEMAVMLVGVLNHSNARPAGVTIQTTTANSAVGTVSVQISVRNADGSPQANVNVDEFKQVHNDTAGVAAQGPFTAVLDTCSANVTGSGSSLCIIDANDPTTDVYGNVAGSNQTSVAYSTSNWWVWTGTTGEQYVNGTTDNVDTFSVSFGAATALENAISLTYSSDAGNALVEDFSAMSGDITITDGIGTYAGGSRTFTATLGTTTSTASATSGYSLKVVTKEVAYSASGNTVSTSTQYVPFDNKTATWTTTCPADDSTANFNYAVAFEHTVTFGALIDADGLPANAANPGDVGGAGASTAYGTGVGGANTNMGVSCNDTTRAYTEASTGESLAVSTNNVVSSTAGTMVGITATAYDQYGDGIAGVETEITSVTSTNASDGVATLRGRLVTGTGGTVTLSAVVCAGTTTDKVAWSVTDINSAATEMDAIPTSAAGANLAGEGLTVYCLTAGTDGLKDQVAPARATWVWTTSTAGAALADQDSGTFVVTVGTLGAFTLTAAAGAGQVTAATIAAGINALSGISGVTCAASGDGDITTTCTFAAGTGTVAAATGGAISAVSTLEDADADNATGEAADTWTDGTDGVTVMYVEDDPTNNYFIANITTTGDTGTDGASVAEQAYTKFTYDDTDVFELDGADGEIAASLVGASETEWEALGALLTGEAGDTPMTINYRTGSTTTGVSHFLVGS